MSASEVFQHTIAQVLNDIPGVKNVSDDILVYGKTQMEHDNSLRTVLKRLIESGLTLNKAKYELNKSELEFFGYVFSANGSAMIQSV